MKIKTKEVYYCEHCGKYYLSKRFAELHEKRCNNNPENHKACMECFHCEMRNVVVANDYANEQQPDTLNRELLFCKKKQICLIPPKAEHRGNAYEVCDYDNVIMPKECSEQLIYELDFWGNLIIKQ